MTAAMGTDCRLTSIVTPTVGRQLRWQYLQRIRGDYRPAEAISALAAHTSGALSEEIVRRVEEYLNAQ